MRTKCPLSSLTEKWLDQNRNSLHKVKPQSRDEAHANKGKEYSQIDHGLIMACKGFYREIQVSDSESE